MTRRPLTERDVLHALTYECKKRRVMYVRMSFRPGVAAGWPDVLILPKNGHAKFVELKRPGGVASKLQKFVMKKLEENGYECRVIDNPDDARAYVAAQAVAA